MENRTITLTTSGLTAAFKGFVPHRLARRINELIIGDRPIDINGGSAAISQEVTLTGADLTKFNDILVLGLLVQLGDTYAVDGRQALADALDELDEADFGQLLSVANEIWQVHSAKTNPKG